MSIYFNYYLNGENRERSFLKTFKEIKYFNNHVFSSTLRNGVSSPN